MFGASLLKNQATLPLLRSVVIGPASIIPNDSSPPAVLSPQVLGSQGQRASGMIHSGYARTQDRHESPSHFASCRANRRASERVGIHQSRFQIRDDGGLLVSLDMSRLRWYLTNQLSNPMVNHRPPSRGLNATFAALADPTRRAILRDSLRAKRRSRNWPKLLK